MASVDPSMVYDDTLAAVGSAPRRIGGSLAAGQIVGGRYRVGRLLGSGGMGLVFEGTHIELGSPVAIKIVRPQFSQDSHILERFVNEARNVAALTNPHIARVFDAGKLNTGEAYLVMERLIGQDMATLLSRSGPLPWPLAVAYVAQACEGLADAHAHGIVHRDLKPEHVFIVQSGTSEPLVKILDFGISKNIRQDEARMTLPGDSIGSPLYMSPEQIQNPALVDERTDVWSLGVVLYEAITGKLPFDGDTIAQVQWRVIAEEPSSLQKRCPDAPWELETIILRCLSKSPMERFGSVDELRRALRQLTDTVRSSVQPVVQAPAPVQIPMPAGPAPATPEVAAPAHVSEPPHSRGLSEARALALEDPTPDELRAAGLPKSSGRISAALLGGGLILALVALGSVSLGGVDNLKAWSQGLNLDEHPSRFEPVDTQWTPPLMLPMLTSAASPPPAAPAGTSEPSVSEPSVSPAPVTEPAPAAPQDPRVPTVAPAQSPRLEPKPRADEPSLSREQIEARYQQWLEQEKLVPVDEVTLDEALSHPQSP